MAGQSGLSVCTAAFGCEAAHVRVLANSLREQHPEARFVALLLDDPLREIMLGDTVEVARPADLGIEGYEHLAALEDAAELRAIGAAWLLRHLRRGGDVALLYLDPSSRIYAPLDPLGPMLDDCDLALTPTLSSPLPDDGRRPGPAEIANWPAFDPGLVGVGRHDVGPLLDWWAERSSPARADADGTSADGNGWWAEGEEIPIPADRRATGAARWLDLVAGMAALRVLGAGWNTGYWNLPGRELRRRGSAYEVDGSPLRSFNFRGFDPRRPALLSAGQDRVSLADDPDLAGLCASYAAELEEHRADESLARPYGFGALPDGTPLTPRVRELYRKWAQSAPRAGSVFTQAGQDAFFDWLREPAAPGGASRYLYAVYLERPDLQWALPVGVPEFARRLEQWAAEAGGAEMQIPASLMPAAPRGRPSAGSTARRALSGAARRAPLPGRRMPGRLPFDAWGVNVVGYHRADFGVAAAGRLAVEALDARQVPLLPIHDLSLARFKAPGPRFASLSLESARFPINLFCLPGDKIVELNRRAGGEIFERRYSIGYWAWEADRLAEAWLPAFELLDEVWVTSTYVAEAVSPSSPVPVNHVPHPVIVDPAPALDRGSYGIGEEQFLFLYVFDFDSAAGRKNPAAAVEAFERAFAPGSGAALLLKTSFGDNAPGDFEALRQKIAAHPDVHLVDRRVSPVERDALIAGCDCYLSLHRSEGFGLTPAEAMAYGKPVIATGLGGNTDYMDEDNSYLVDYRLVEIGEGLDPYPAEGRWAEPDTEHAAGLMRRVRDNPAEARERGERAAELRRSHSPEAIGGIMERRLTEIRARSLRPSRAVPGLEDSLRAMLGRLLRSRRGGSAGSDAEQPLPPTLSAAVLAQARAQERRMRRLEAANQTTMRRR